MIDFLIVLLVFLWGSTLMSALILVRHRQHPACRQFAWAAENDSDIKIAPDFSSKSPLPKLEPSEEEILLYFKHKQCRNLEKARCLGQQLGEQLLCLPQDLAQAQLIGSCWAKMTGKPQDPAHCQLGSRLYQWMKARCEQLVCSVQFQTV